MLDQPKLKWLILMVDDDEEDYLITNVLLNGLPGRTVQLDWAPTYEAGQARLQSSAYDAVLVDYDLGLRTGLDLIRETVALDYPAPLILYTGRGSYAVDVEAMQAGATMYLAKAEATPLLMERFLRYAIERKRSQDALNRQNQARSELLESIQDGFFSIDRAWYFRYANQKAAAAGNLDPQDLIGKNLWEAYPMLLGTEYETNYRYVMEQRQPRHFEVESVYRDTWFSISVYPSVDGISIFWQDISQRKRLEEEFRSLALFPDENVNPVLRLSAGGELLYANPAARAIFCQPDSEERAGLPQALVQAGLAALQQAAAQEIETAYAGRVFSFAIVPLVERGYINLYGVDVTTCKQAEAELQACRAALARSTAQHACSSG